MAGTENNTADVTEYERWLEEKCVPLEGMGLGSAGYSLLGCSVEALRSGLQRPWDARPQAIQKFAFAIPNREVIERLRTYAPILEVGSGTGYWAWELQKAGIDVIATDPDPYSDNVNRPRALWCNIEPFDALTAIDRFGIPRALFMCWPSYKAEWPAQALAQYEEIGGETFIYIGEGPGGCTGDDAFHARLESHWIEVENIRIPQWFGVHDLCTVYRRNGE